MTQTAYDDIKIRMYIAFATEEALNQMLEKSELEGAEKEQIRESVSLTTFGNKHLMFIVTNRKPGKDLPRIAYEFATAIYEHYPYEGHFNVRKDGGIDLSDGLHNFGFDMQTYEGPLQAFKF
jgi:hypothetical protein